jgi:hypothetical protein
LESREQDFALALMRQDISITQIECVVHLACARKYVALLNHGDATLISSFLYFAGPIDEVASSGTPLSYWQYTSSKMLEMEELWRKSSGDERTRHG